MTIQVLHTLQLREFQAWSGGADTVNSLSFSEMEVVEEFINDTFHDIPVTDTQLNDILRFERDFIAELIGYTDWEALIDCPKR